MALAERLDLPHQVLMLDDPSALKAALSAVDLVLNAAGPFLHTASPLSQACLRAGVHYLDISNELQVFRALYYLDKQARRAGVSIIPGVGFGVVATNCLALHVSEAIGGAEHLEVASRVASAQPGPGAAVTMQQNIPYGGWIRQGGHLIPKELFTGVTAIDFPDGLCEAMPVPTGDLEAAFHATGSSQRHCLCRQCSSPRTSSTSPNGDSTPSTFRVVRVGKGNRARRLLVRGLVGDRRLLRLHSRRRASAPSRRLLGGTPHGALSPAAAFGADFAFTVQGTTLIDVPEMSLNLVPTGESNG